MSNSELRRLVALTALDAVVCAASGNAEGVAEAVAKVAEHGDAAVFAACCAWAATPGVLGLVAEGGVASLEIRDGRGRLVEPEAVPAELAPCLWAGRFVAAQMNDDFDACMALFRAIPRDQVTANLLALLEIAAHAIVAAKRQESTEGGPSNGR